MVVEGEEGGGIDEQIPDDENESKDEDEQRALGEGSLAGNWERGRRARADPVRRLRLRVRPAAAALRLVCKDVFACVLWASFE